MFVVAVSPVSIDVELKIPVSNFVAASTIICTATSVSTAFCFSCLPGWVYWRVIIIEAWPG